jgi:hypothetical protein
MADLVLPPAAVAEFRAFATQQGVSIPVDSETDAELQRVLVRAAARAKFGDRGYYRVAALVDPLVRQAAQQFGRASAILAKAQ